MTSEAVKELVKSASGAPFTGIAKAAPVAAEDTDRYRSWISTGHHGCMDYMTRYDDVRADPRMLLDGACSIIVAAFPYFHPDPPLPSRRRIARYARGEDYHAVVRRRLNSAVDVMKETLGGEYRVCVDTAPLRERYWAVRAGLGFIGRNNTLIIPGAGSYFFLGEIITTLPLTPDEPCSLSCGDCGRCVRACPVRALDGNGALDASRCLSCVTIEQRGPLPPGTRLHGRLAGCDTCQEVCPHNSVKHTAGLPEFAPTNPLLTLTDAELDAADEAVVRPLLKRSALSRIKPADFLRNIRLS
ncbi:MAG: tRNA epoxyqueuosine(34) reductase QueG [Candidatus Amulumruptor caecigallinarius]|nr:tRNA epoxyqueuosine(34) reductase QueG [Candidatus Amulumruptor caecigallinarius]MCM1395978.1 tRNA epoxyqueuosine(34) reductase QueG [Candidatus Amulumruptor caecigallinarius]MCM1453010.1 tRNA epoxyqueuosine(34) reductase QueG [bacterium]